ncbi:[histone H3]-lysine(4) N-trimethyltransferase [Ranunculus cassubicifolius]
MSNDEGTDDLGSQERDELIFNNVGGYTGFEGKSDVNNLGMDSETDSETTISDGMPPPLPPRRSTRQNKIQVRTGKNSGRRGKAVGKELVSFGFVSAAVRRKRSCPCKQARTSVWGNGGNNVRVKENEVIGKDDDPLVEVENKWSHQITVSSGNGRRQNTHGNSSEDTKEIAYAPNNRTGRISLKVRFRGQNGKTNLEPVQSEALDSAIPCPTFVDKCTSKPGNSLSMGVKLEDNPYDSRDYTCAAWNLENPVPSLGTDFLDSLNVDKDLNSTITQDASVVNGFSNCPLGYLQTGTEETDETTCKQYSDPGTSPDSEVINLIHDTGGGIDTVLTTTQAVALDEVAASNRELTSFLKQNKSSKVVGVTDSSARFLMEEEKSLGCNKQKHPAKNRQDREVGANNPIDTSNLGSFGNGLRHSLDTEVYNNDLAELGNIHERIRHENLNRTWESSRPYIEVNQSGLFVPKAPLGTCKTMGLKASSKLGAEVRKQSSTAPVSDNRRKNSSGKKKQGSRKSASKRKVKEENSLGQVLHNGGIGRGAGGRIDTSSETTELSVSPGLSDIIKEENLMVEVPSGAGIPTGNTVSPNDLPEASMLPIDFDGKFLPSPDAWVCCDDCHKWRCISTALADSIEATNRRWICTDNLDKAFSNCSTPQEKSNVEINRELELAEFSGEEDASAQPVSKGVKDKQITAPKPAPWRPIVSNMFLHRNRKNQSIDEIMICHCKPPPDGEFGCGDECLNRMLNIECVRGTCPCGDRCSNQQFQKRKYAKLESVRCGKKGYGLHLLESVSQGDFLIEYVGEVLDLNAYEARQREYASRGQRHFYFMTLNGSEVIDACEKGNLGRFINHSCNPNCRTEKWMVNGEVCIGLFAIKNIKKGEELTFDYNYVRVFGAAAKRCVCGSSECRGYIGGDPSNSDVVVQGDSDEEFFEPVMVNEVGEFEKVVGRITSDTILSVGEQLPNAADTTITSAFSTTPTESYIDKEEESTTLQLQPMEDILPAKVDISEMSIQAEVVEKSSIEEAPLNDDTVRKTIPVPTSESPESSSTVTASISDSLLPDLHVKPPKGKSTVSKVRQKTSKAARVPAKSIKKGSKHVSNQINSSKTQVVASKPKKVLEGAADSRPKGVEEKLNELLDTDGGISKKRDATKGYLTLLFVTAASGDNANGEATQSTRDLSIILDALLKTKKRIVLNDIINKNGLQMLHNIMKQNRKNFNRIPIIRKLLKILEYLAEREILTVDLINSGPPCAGMESFRESILDLTRHTDVKVHQIAREFRNKWLSRTFVRNSNTSMEQQQQAGGFHSSNNLRVSPYKQQQWNNNNSWNPMDNAETAPVSCSLQVNGNRKNRKRKSRWDLQPGEGHVSVEDAPPGFPSSSSSLQVVTGRVKQIFSSELPVSYGVPMLFVDQLGAPHADSADSWEISPSIPFHPFPPLPPYQSLKRKPESSPSEQPLRDPCTSGRAPIGDGGNIGRRYFKQQKWNHPRNSHSQWGFNKPWSKGSGDNNNNTFSSVVGSHVETERQNHPLHH